ncbi:type II toxin-antitoxin system antitoxin DNA ADP-ribosyl glycohydrolase DarG [Viridibacillus arvi]|uniref:type II toxin-antitoxin system antitoxin DNA ADP-ribosyl glycohydrolase DarG n=1 Tax=Viridibacillus arvi TaxID=263475 RepID=UPI003D06D7B4
MIIYTTGDLLKSDANALVNTVNCEGYMGKGIAYQFKKHFPENNKDYVRACKSDQLEIGKLHYTFEREKLIINFPTKNKWRAKSKMEYIEKGLDALIILINQLKITSVALPPLGSGNGGLPWGEVKHLIEQKLKDVSSFIDVYIYEPTKNYSAQSTVEPKLNFSSLLLMEIKHHLKKFNKLRLQHATFFVTIFSKEKYFDFQKQVSGPHDKMITIISSDIRKFQNYHKVKNTREAKDILFNKLVSENITNKLADITPIINRVCDFINSIKTDRELECLSKALYLINENDFLSNVEEICQKIVFWSEDNSNHYSKDEVVYCITKLQESKMIEPTLVGYAISEF